MFDEWHVMIAETVTGNIVADVMPTTMPSFTRILNDPGSIGISVRVDAPENASVDFHTYVTPGRYSWVVAYGTYIVQAGPIWSFSFDDHTLILSVSCSGIYGLFSRRVTRNTNGTKTVVDPSQNLTYTNRSNRAIMANLINDNMKQPYCGLPIVVSNLTETGTNTTTYYAYDLKAVSDNVNALAQIDQGPEFDFAPQFTPSNTAIQWVLNIGNPTLGNQASNNVWDYGGSLTSIAVDVNGSTSPVSRVWAKGSGSATGLVSGFYEDDTQQRAGCPALDYVDSSHTSVTDLPSLNAWAKSDQQNLNAPFETWKCSVRIDGRLSEDYGSGQKVAPGLGDFVLGDAPTFFVYGHPWLSTGAYRRRIMGFTSDTPYTVGLDLFQTLSFQ